MERKALGRDLGLSVRMAVVGALLAALYIALASAVALFISLDPDNLGLWVVVFPLAIGIWGHFFKSDVLVLRAARARPVEPQEAAELHGIVERLAAVADVRKPKVAVMTNPMPNAFATGRTASTTTIVVTTGLLERLDTPELEAVVAHEIAHVANRDALVMTMASYFPLLGAVYSRRRFAGRHFGRELRANTLADRLTFTVIKPFGLALYASTLVLMFAISRYRELTADRGAALLTGAPEQLMSALQKLAGDIPRIPERDLRAVAGLSAFFIVGTGKRKRFEFLMDHPPLEKRLRELGEIAREIGRAQS